MADPIAYMRDAHEGEGEPCYVPAAKGDLGAFPVFTADVADFESKRADGLAAANLRIVASNAALTDRLREALREAEAHILGTAYDFHGGEREHHLQAARRVAAALIQAAKES